MPGEPETLDSGRSELKPFANNGGPLSNANAFIRHAFPMVSPFVQAAVDTLVQSMGGKAIPGAPYTVNKSVNEVRGNDYTGFLAHMDNRPVIVLRRNNSDEHYVVPLEGFVNPLDFFSLPGVPRKPKGAQAPLGTQAPSAGQAPPTGQAPPQQQRPMSLFDYMSKLPPNERMLYTLLIYMLLSDAISNVFRHNRGGGQAQSAMQQASTGWMPGPPRGSQWIVWG
jgi:hypothetical protein